MRILTLKMAAVKKKKKKNAKKIGRMLFFTRDAAVLEIRQCIIIRYYRESDLMVNRDRKGIIMKQKDEWF